MKKKNIIYFLLILNLNVYCQNWEWVKSFGDFKTASSTNGTIVNCLNLDNINNLSITGYSIGIQNIQDSLYNGNGFITKINKINGGINSQGINNEVDNYQGVKTKYDLNNNVIVNNYKYESSISGFAHSIVKQNNSNTLIWKNILTDGAEIKDFSIDKNGNIYIVGQFNSWIKCIGIDNTAVYNSNGGWGYRLLKFNTDGYMLWHKPISYLNHKIKCINNDVILLNENGRLLKYNNQGDYIRTLDSIDGGSNYIFDIDNDYNVLISCRYTNAVLINNKVGYSGTGSMFAKLDTLGNIKWSKELPTHILTDFSKSNKSIGITGIVGNQTIFGLASNVNYRFIASLNFENGNVNFIDTLKDVNSAPQQWKPNLPLILSDGDNFYICDGNLLGITKKFGDIIYNDQNKNFIAKISDNYSKVFSISTISNPTSYGVTSGSGGYNYNQNAIITATPNNNFKFVNWTENGTIISTSNPYTFTVQSNRILTANFENIKDTVYISVSPANSGVVTGQGIYNRGDNININATASSGYTYTNLTENSNILSTNNPYSYISNGNKSLVVNFSPTSSIIDTKSSRSIYPNPTNSIINIEGFNNLKYEIFGIEGILLKEGFIKNNTISIKELKSGVYFLKIRDKSFKIQKE